MALHSHKRKESGTCYVDMEHSPECSVQLNTTTCVKGGKRTHTQNTDRWMFLLVYTLSGGHPADNTGYFRVGELGG